LSDNQLLLQLKDKLTLPLSQLINQVQSIITVFYHFNILMVKDVYVYQDIQKLIHFVNLLQQIHRHNALQIQNELGNNVFVIQDILK
jgi:hypothetical protein